jgi:hypothetical protein
MRATPSTSPFFAVPERTISSVGGQHADGAPATAVRAGLFLAPTSTIRAAPRSSKWVSFPVIFRPAFPS